MNVIDISMDINEAMTTYPDNPDPSFDQYSEIPDDVTNETMMRLGSHTGTHVDAPLHVDNHGEEARDIELNKCYGACRVIDIGPDSDAVTRRHVEAIEPENGEIILFKTRNSYDDKASFDEDYVYVDRGAAETLIDAGVKAVGIDYLSIKQFSGDNDVHERLINNTVVYEGLRLDHVTPGTYTFAGFPLKLPVDGGMTRAVLIDDS